MLQNSGSNWRLPLYSKPFTTTRVTMRYTVTQICSRLCGMWYLVTERGSCLSFWLRGKWYAVSNACIDNRRSCLIVAGYVVCSTQWVMYKIIVAFLAFWVLTSLLFFDGVVDFFCKVLLVGSESLKSQSISVYIASHVYNKKIILHISHSIVHTL